MSNIQNPITYNLTNITENPESAKATDFCIETVGEVSEADIPISMNVSGYMNPSKEYKMIGKKLTED